MGTSDSSRLGTERDSVEPRGVFRMETPIRQQYEGYPRGPASNWGNYEYHRKKTFIMKTTTREAWKEAGKDFSVGLSIVGTLSAIGVLVYFYPWVMAVMFGLLITFGIGIWAREYII